jgi:hypothetical protein
VIEGAGHFPWYDAPDRDTGNAQLATDEQEVAEVGRGRRDRGTARCEHSVEQARIAETLGAVPG